MMTTQTTLPPTWDLTDPSTWAISQSVDAHMGYHEHTGYVMRERRDIICRAMDYDNGDIADCIDQGQDPAQVAAWWYDVLDAMLAGRVALEEASPERIEAARLEIDELMEYASDGIEAEGDAYREIAQLLGGNA